MAAFVGTYTCGYVTRALIKKLKRSAHPLKEEMVCCLVELNEPEEDTEHGSEDWIKRIDRGGLTHDIWRVSINGTGGSTIFE